jgi:predicted transcriptional regulator
MDLYSKTDKALLAEMGARVRWERLDQNLTQAHLATWAGVDVGVLRKMEAGCNFTLLNFLRVLRALQKLERMELLLLDIKPSPVALAKLIGKERKRASGKRRKAEK